MQCIRCRRELSEEARFCPDCGLKIDTKDAGAAVAAPASSGLPGLPLVSMESSSTEKAEGEFVPSSYDQITSPVPASYNQNTSPMSSSYNQITPSVPAAYFQGGYAAPVYQMPSYPVDESDYYHIDATEKYNFEAFRGISIVVMVLSVLTMFGILFPLPICIVTLILSCMSADERDPARAKSRFKTCRVLSIISIIAIIILVVAIYVLRYLVNYTELLNL